MGIYKDKRSGSWVARGKTVNGKRPYIGSFKSEAEAENAYALHDLTHLSGTFTFRYDETSVYELPKKRGFLARLFRRA